MDAHGERDKGIRILSLDGGGPGCYSQLVILKEIMSGIAYDQRKDLEDVIPGDYFDFIGGTGFGAYIAVMLGILRMNLDDIIDGLLALADSLFSQDVPETPQTPAMYLQTVKDAITDMLQRHGIDPDIKLNDERLRSSRSKVGIIAVSASNISRCQIFRNYTSRQTNINCTLVEALCASMATPPLFDPVPIGSRLRQQMFIGGAVGYYNPMRELLKEAKAVFGDEQRLAVVLSLGCGHPPTLSLSSAASLSMNIESLVKYIGADCERVARELSSQLVEVDAYVRLNVTHGLEEIVFDDWSCMGVIEDHTKTYLETSAVSQAIVRILGKISEQSGSITLGQIVRTTVIRRMAKTVPSLSPYYVARNDEWEIIQGHLINNPEEKRKIFVITGMGGCGKTQMVSYFVEKNRERYNHIFFVDGSTVATIRGDLESAIRPLEGHQHDTHEAALAFMSSRSSAADWLYIVDNVDDPDLDLIPYLPSCAHGTIIITSRNRNTRHLATTHHLELGPMLQEEAVEALSRASRKVTPLTDNELDQANLLVEELGRLPLALVQAGIYISELSSSSSNEGGFTFGQYMSLFRRHGEQLMRQKGRIALDKYPNGVYAALDLSYTRLSQPCRQFLHLCSFFRYSNIAVPMFSNAAQTHFEDEQVLSPRDDGYQDVQNRLRRLFCNENEWDELGFNDILQSLSSLSLVSISSMYDTILLRFHPLVHLYARDKLAAEERAIYKQMAVTCISSSAATLPTSDQQYVIPHCMQIYEQDGNHLLHMNDIVRFGWLMGEQGNYQPAEEIFRRIIEGLADTQGGDDEDKIQVSQWLSIILGNQGKWDEAEVLQKEVSSLCQRTLGPKDPRTIQSFSQLGKILTEQGRWKEAEVLLRHVLATRQADLGPNHLDTITASSKLTSNLHKQGHLDEAEMIAQQVLATSQKVLGPDHPKTIDICIDLGAILQDQDKLDEAEEMCRRVLSSCQRMFGPENRRTAEASFFLARALAFQGQYSKAEKVIREILPILQKVRGSEDPGTVWAFMFLASLLRLQGKVAEALTLSLQGTELGEKTFGKYNPALLSYLKELGHCYESLAMHPEATEVRERITRIKEDKKLMENRGQEFNVMAIISTS
ncbi:hypothetical protein CPB86DRAFT_809169 [Serendipita vermifera]|nr:hypothetical protein CPB86DRAFT_809169 [Serendipita vermifera]